MRADQALPSRARLEAEILFWVISSTDPGRDGCRCRFFLTWLSFDLVLRTEVFLD